MYNLSTYVIYIASLNVIFFQWSYKTKVLPIINAIFVHALMHGKDTMPSRHAIQSNNKVLHGKRGWGEVNAKGWVLSMSWGYYPYFHLLLWM